VEGLLLCVYRSGGAAIVGGYCLHIFDGYLSFLWIEDVGIISLCRLVIDLLVVDSLLVGRALSHRVYHALILLHNHDQTILRLRLNFSCCTHNLVEIRNILRIAFGLHLQLNGLIRHFTIAANIPSFFNASRLSVYYHLRILPLLLSLCQSNKPSSEFHIFTIIL